MMLGDSLVASLLLSSGGPGAAVLRDICGSTGRPPAGGSVTVIGSGGCRWGSPSGSAVIVR